jgi:peptide deformylase
MSILKVARMGHPVLRQRARALDKSDLRSPVVQRLIDDMIETMYEYHGVGLAAPQIHESLRVFVAMLQDEPDADSEATAIINPEIVPAAETTEEGWEGCLSIPDIRGMVPRYLDINVRGLDRQGKPLQLRLRNFPARVAQHETDHLDGVLFFDRMRSMETLTFLDEYSRYWTKSEGEA